MSNSKKCPKGHVIDPNWEKCAYCEAEKRAKQKSERPKAEIIASSEDRTTKVGSSFYVVGGTIKPGSPSYIERKADDELYHLVVRGEFCFVLTARQMGKSSIMARTAQKLRAAGMRTVIIDLTQIGGTKSGLTATQWYYGVVHCIVSQLDVKINLGAWWNSLDRLPALQRFNELFDSIVLKDVDKKVIIFIDEIDSTVGLPFSDDFFSAVRYIYNARAIKKKYEKVSFVLLGTATPSELIQDSTQTPFNIGHGIELTDFTLEEAMPLAQGLGTEPQQSLALLERILYWTGGHPYLTQSLCCEVSLADKNLSFSAMSIVDQLVEKMYLSERSIRQDHNLNFVESRLSAAVKHQKNIIENYVQIRSGRDISEESDNPVHAVLKLTGIVKTNSYGKLRVRNLIYKSVFTTEWANKELVKNQIRARTIEPKATVGDYVISSKIGEGGLAEVFLALNRINNEQVVVKQLYLDLVGNAEIASRHFEAVKVLCRIGHPNLVKVIDHFETGGRYVVVEEYLSGGSLADLLKNSKSYTESQLLKWVKQGLLGLNFAHQNGIVHRDIKPSNLLIDGDTNLKVNDFGVALVYGRRSTRTGHTIGTPTYMSPEQITRPKSLDRRTDVYSMGLVLYEMLTGELPYDISDTDSDFSIQSAIVKNPVIPPRKRNSNISKQLEKIILKAISKNPDRRYADCKEFTKAIEAYRQSLNKKHSITKWIGRFQLKRFS